MEALESSSSGAAGNALDEGNQGSPCKEALKAGMHRDPRSNCLHSVEALAAQSSHVLLHVEEHLAVQGHA